MHRFHCKQKVMASFESQKLILCLWVFIINFYIEVSQSQWIEADDPFPRISDEMAIGEYNGTIFIFGGWTYSRQLVEYEINTQTLTDRGTSFLPDNRARGGNGQYWTQQGHIVYLLEHPSPNTFDIFDLSTTQYTSNWNNITLDTNVGFSACFASSQSFLYILGGYLGATVMWSKVVQIVSLTTYEWIDNPPYIQHSRGNLACIVYNDYLWAFGGQNTGGSLASNERINIL
eukprot:638008_1